MADSLLDFFVQLFKRNRVEDYTDPTYGTKEVLNSPALPENTVAGVHPRDPRTIHYANIQSFMSPSVRRHERVHVGQELSGIQQPRLADMPQRLRYAAQLASPGTPTAVRRHEAPAYTFQYDRTEPYDRDLQSIFNQYMQLLNEYNPRTRMRTMEAFMPTELMRSHLATEPPPVDPYYMDVRSVKGRK